MFEQFLFHLELDFWKFGQNFQKLLFSDGQTSHLGEGFVNKTESYVVTNLKPANYSRGAVLPAHKLLFIYFVADFISPFINKNYF